MRKHYYFKEEFKSRNKHYGYNNCELSMYFIDKEGNPHLIDRIEYQTGSYAGGQQTTYMYLVDHGYIPKKLIDSQYYGNKQVYKHIKIHEMF